MKLRPTPSERSKKPQKSKFSQYAARSDALSYQEVMGPRQSKNDSMAASSEGAAKRKRGGPGRPWSPGQSGNPAGRKPDAEIRKVHELCRPFTADAVNALVDIMSNSPSDRAKVAAATELLDRGWGKAPASLLLSMDQENPLKVQVESLSDADLEQKVAESLERKKAQANGTKRIDATDPDDAESIRRALVEQGAKPPQDWEEAKNELGLDER